MLRGNANTLKGYPNLNQSRNLRPRYCCPLAFHAELVRVQSQHGRSTDVIFTTNIKQSKDEEHLGLVIGERLQEGAPLNCIHITAAVNKLANLRHSRVGSCRHDQCVESQAEVQEQHPKARAHAWISAETMLQPQTQTSVVATLVDELVGLLDCHIDDFQPRQVATILRALSLLPEMALLASSRGLDVKLMTASEHALCHCKPQELCCALSAIARLNWQPSTVWLQAFMTACSSKWSHFNLHELSMVLWSVAKIKWPHNSSITDDRLHTSNSLQKSCPNKSSGAVHSDDGYAGIEKAVLSWIQDLLLHQAGLLPLDGHQLPDISLSIWSLTRMGILPPKLWLTAFSECVTKRLCGFKGRELALILWSLPRVVPRETLLLGHEQWRSDRERKEEEFNHVATGSVINNPSGSPGLYYGQLLESGAHEEGAVAADVSALKDSGDGAGLFHTSHAMRMSLLAKKVMKRCKQLIDRGWMSNRHVLMCYQAILLIPEGLCDRKIWMGHVLPNFLLATTGLGTKVDAAGQRLFGNEEQQIQAAADAVVSSLKPVDRQGLPAGLSVNTVTSMNSTCDTSPRDPSCTGSVNVNNSQYRLPVEGWTSSWSSKGQSAANPSINVYSPASNKPSSCHNCFVQPGYVSQGHTATASLGLVLPTATASLGLALPTATASSGLALPTGFPSSTTASPLQTAGVKLWQPSSRSDTSSNQSDPSSSTRSSGNDTHLSPPLILKTHDDQRSLRNTSMLSTLTSQEASTLLSLLAKHVRSSKSDLKNLCSLNPNHDDIISADVQRYAAPLVLLACQQYVRDPCEACVSGIKQTKAGGIVGEAWSGSVESTTMATDCPVESHFRGSKVFDSHFIQTALSRHPSSVGTPSSQNLGLFVTMLSSLPRLAPYNAAVLEWCEEVVEDVLAPAARAGQLSPTQLTHTLWALSHLTGRCTSSQRSSPRGPYFTQGEDSQMTFKAHSSESNTDITYMPSPELHHVAAARRSKITGRSCRMSEIKLSSEYPPPRSSDSSCKSPSRSGPSLTVSRKAMAALIEGTRKSLGACSAGELAMIAFSCSRLNAKVGKEFLKLLQSASLNKGLEKHSDRDLSLMLWSLARMTDHRETPFNLEWIANAMQEVDSRCGSMHSHSILAVLLALAALESRGWRPDVETLVHTSSAPTDDDRSNSIVTTAWLSSLLSRARRSIRSMAPWQKDLAFKAATSVKPELAGVWGKDFSILLRDSHSTPLSPQQYFVPAGQMIHLEKNVSESTVFISDSSDTTGKGMELADISMQDSEIKESKRTLQEMPHLQTRACLSTLNEGVFISRPPPSHQPNGMNPQFHTYGTGHDQHDEYQKMNICKSDESFPRSNEQGRLVETLLDVHSGADVKHMISLLHAAAALQVCPPASFMVVLKHTALQVRWSLKPADLSYLMEALGRLETVNLGQSKWMKEMLAVVHGRIQYYSATQLLKVCWGLSRMECRPSDDWMDCMIIQIRAKIKSTSSSEA